MPRRRPPPPGQLDLFVDSDSGMLVNDVVDALLRYDERTAKNLLERLSAADPDYGKLKELKDLCGFLCDWPRPMEGPAELAAELQRMAAEILPAAKSVMGIGASKFAEGFWLGLAEAARPLAFDPDHPEASAASLYLRCGRYAAAADAVEAIPGWRDEPVALCWMIEAQNGMRGWDAAFAMVIRLAFLAPGRVSAVIEAIGPSDLQKYWRRFLTVCDELESGDEAANAWFPAWYRLQRPEQSVPPDKIPDAGAPAKAFRLLGEILKLEKTGLSPELLQARRQLRDLNSWFYGLYMASREKESGGPGWD